MRQLIRILHAGFFWAGVGLFVLTTAPGCSNTQEAENNNDADNGNAEANHGNAQDDEDSRRTRQDILEERRTEFKSDNYEQARQELVERFAEQLVGRDLRIIGFAELVMPTEAEFIEGIEHGDKDWIVYDLFFDHFPGYVETRAHELYIDMRRSVTSAPVFGEIPEVDEVREEFSRMILESHTPDFSPDARRRLGQFAQAEAMVFTRLTTTFEAVRSPTAFSYYAHWMRGEYILDVRIVSVERGTTLWHDSVRWERTFLLSRYH